LRILVIDDDGDDIYFFIKAVDMIDPNIKLHTAIDGEAGLKLVRSMERLPDFIFLDVNMPRMNGTQCLKALKADAKLSHIPVFIMSTSRTADEMQEMRQLGCAAYFEKPPTLRELTSIISGVIGHDGKKSAKHTVPSDSSS
ncbi:MAG TPA: response regulator, partial [Cyclobacteriaceae bacterium]|nr:response regulator [Cyclobacteriaceae bacterium]